MVRDRSMDIAVTGISARFPGVNNLNEWWRALQRGDTFIKRYQENELLEAGVSPSQINDPNYIPVRAHLIDADRFDCKFFRVSPRDAELMDPQHRLMLEVAWSALEDAGYGNANSRPKTAVFASGSGSSYLRSMLMQGPLDYDTLEQALHGTEPDFIASLIAYKLNLTGPAVAIQTACSSSLVSIHFAIQSLLNGDCDQALVVAAGINFPQAGYLYMSGGIKSGSGICRPFDQNADGVVEGSGVACVVLKRFDDALHEAPEFYGIILGSAINNDGSTKVGYYAPSVEGQSSVIQTAIKAADIDATSIGYLETHGTGTNIGDPIEWTASSEAYTSLGANPEQIAIGAVKANIGHLDAAAGLASLIKTLFIVKEGVIPPVANFQQLNSFLKLENTPFYIPTQAKCWNSDELRRAAISAFGIGGTNAHLIIEEPPHFQPRDFPLNIEKNVILMLSAFDVEALTRLTENIKNFLIENLVNLADVAYTLAHGRYFFSERLIVYGQSKIEIIEKINKNKIIRGSVPADISIKQTTNPKELTSLLHENQTKNEELLAVLARLWVQGYPIEPSLFCKQGKKIHLPTYPFYGPRWLAPEAAASLYSTKEEYEKKTVKIKYRNQIHDSLPSTYRILANIWSELLNYNELTESSDFFDLGGDSLLFVSLIKEIQQTFEINISPRILLTTRNLSQQVEVINRMLKDKTLVK